MPQEKVIRSTIDESTIFDDVEWVITIKRPLTWRIRFWLAKLFLFLGVVMLGGASIEFIEEE